MMRMWPVVTIFAGVACIFPLSANANPASSLVVRAEPLADVTSVAGMVEGEENAEARARIGGTLEKVKVERGTWVKKGQVLGVVHDARLGQQVTGLQTQLESAEKNLQRLKELLPLDAASPAQVEQAEAQVAALRSQRENAGQSRTDGNILAPFDGQFVALKVVSGTVMMPGESLGTVASAPLRLKLSLPERQAALLATGDEVPLWQAEETDDQPLLQGTVQKVYPQVVNGRITVDVALPDTSSSTRPLTVGQKVMAQVTVGQRKGIAVPQAFVSVRNNLSFVRLENGSDVLVQTGYPRAGGMVEILSGLQDGDKIVKP